MDTVNQHVMAAKLFFDCGHAELKPLDATTYRHVYAGGLCTACRNEATKSPGGDEGTMIEKYYLKADHQPEWQQVTREQFIAAEQAAGFRSKFGDNHPATGGFSGKGLSGRVDYIESSNESPAPRAGEWHADSNGGWGYVWQGGACLAKCPEPSRAEQIVTEHNQHSILLAQRDRLLRLLRPVTSPTACYCAVMRDEKCWHCEARELIATIEQEGKS